MQCTAARQLSVAIENQPGRLAAICRLLSLEGINIRDLTVVDNVEQGMIRFIPSDPALCKSLLTKAGLCVVEADVLVILLKDLPGELGRIAEKLGVAGVNIDYAYGTEDSSERELRLVLKVSNLPAARSLLESLVV